MKRRQLKILCGCLGFILFMSLACSIPTPLSTPLTPPITPTPLTSSDEVLIVTGSGSIIVSSGEAGVLTTDSGAQLEIPNGAVPPAEDGSPGTAEFSMEEDFSMTMQLSPEFSQIGPVYRLLPEGTAFGMPVTLTVPIPDDVAIEYVLGAATFDNFSGTWQLLPATVDVLARTVILEVGHFSYYGLFGSYNYFETGESFWARNGGWFDILNTARDGLTTAPFGKPLPASAYYGVCVQAFTYDNSAAESWSWVRPTDWMIGATAQKNQDSTRKQWLPAGTYMLMEMYGIGETNNWDIDYWPEHRYYVRPMGQVVLGVGEHIEFVSPRNWNELESQGFTWSKHPCWMKPMDTPPVEPGDNWTSLEIVNTHRSLTTKTPFGKNLQAEVYYGVCSPNRVFDDPMAETWNWLPPLNWMMGITALGDRDISYTYKLPAGDYSLLEVYHLTEERNKIHDYIPEGRYYYLPVGVVPLLGGQTFTFTSPAVDPGPTGDWGQSLAAAGFSEDSTNPCYQDDSPISLLTPTDTMTGTLEPTPTLTLTPTHTPNPTEVAYVGGFTGTWDSNWGVMTCSVIGTSVHCEYTWDQGRIDAVLSADGKSMDGQWAEYPSYSPPDDGGRVIFSLSEDGNTIIDGYWWYGQNTDGGIWTGTRK